MPSETYLSTGRNALRQLTSKIDLTRDGEAESFGLYDGTVLGCDCAICKPLYVSTETALDGPYKLCAHRSSTSLGHLLREQQTIM